MKRRALLMTVAALPLGSRAQSFDHDYADWTALLGKHVRWLPDGKQSRVDYAGFMADRAALKQVLGAMSAVPQAAFDGWSRAQQMAFLINAYNAFTVELILTKWPDLKSIKDIGGFFGSPWKIDFFTLLGAKRTLDWIEHEQLRPRYKDPRVHAAVNCASIGCPALREEAYVAARLEAQLDEGMTRFLSDRTRNRIKDGELQVSSIFKWFREDFEPEHDFFARWATALGGQPDVIRKLPIDYLDYDWTLNAAGR